jgi:hypothetical protein
MTRNAELFCALISLTPKAVEPLSPASHDGRHTATVSTFVTVDGQLNRPTAAGKGGFNRGFPALPSNDLIGVVSLSHAYAPISRWM